MTFGVGASTHRPKYRLWLGLYIITIYYKHEKDSVSGCRLFRICLMPDECKERSNRTSSKRSRCQRPRGSTVFPWETALCYLHGQKTIPRLQ